MYIKNIAEQSISAFFIASFLYCLIITFIHDFWTYTHQVSTNLNFLIPISLMLRYYLIIINIFTFLLWGFDKRKAIREGWRISEKQLLTFVALGGIGGALMGMKYFRHKTLKGSFLIKFYAITAVRIGIVLLYMNDPEMVIKLLEELK